MPAAIAHAAEHNGLLRLELCPEWQDGCQCEMPDHATFHFPATPPRMVASVDEAGLVQLSERQDRTPKQWRHDCAIEALRLAASAPAATRPTAHHDLAGLSLEA